MIKRFRVREGVFLCLLCCTSFISPPVALSLGFLLALSIGHPFKKYNSTITKYLLQLSVVGLGFGMNFGEVLTAGKTGLLITVVSIFGTLGVGYFIGKWFAVNTKTSQLISVGTAICGGSAIAAIAPIINANEEDISVSLGTIFILNSLALLLFPPMGHYMGLTQRQFGLWSAVAIHDTSSVVGAAARYGNEALKVATAVKLTRALWILPISFLATLFSRSKSSKTTVPFFIFAFIGASIITSVAPNFKAFYAILVQIAKIGLTATLFLIGAGLSRDTLKSVGIKPIAQGIVLWAFILTIALIAVRSFS